MARFTLSKSTNAAGRSVIFVDYSGPAFFGGGDATFVCAHCGEPVASLVAPDRIWDLIVECGHCRGASEFPRLPAGAQASGYVYFPPGRYRITAAVETANGALLIGHGAITGGGSTFRN